MKLLRIINGILLAFIALNAFGGGYYAMNGAPGVPLAWLQGSLFTSYFIPGIFLFVVIGGMCSFGAVVLFKNSKHAESLHLFADSY